MMVLCESAQETLGTNTILKGIRENNAKAACNSCSSTDHDRTETTGKLCKEKTDVTLLRKATASIANALLKLGGSEDSGDTSSCDFLNKSRKRTVSLIAETDASSASTLETEIDARFTDTNKRQRITPSNETCSSSIPSKVCLPVSNNTSLIDARAGPKPKALEEEEEDKATSFSTSEFQIQHKNFNDPKIPGDIGCISQFFHHDFRPLRVAPRLPNYIVPEDPPPMQHSMRSPFAPPTPAPSTMYTAAITEHNDCLIVHSYSVVPRMMPIPHAMSLTQLANGL